MPDCRRCGGKKRVKYDDLKYMVYTSRNCPRCEGKGRTHPSCRNCRGTGFVGKKLNVYPCQVCSGTGNAFVPCRTCGGRRWIDRR